MERNIKKHTYLSHLYAGKLRLKLIPNYKSKVQRKSPVQCFHNTSSDGDWRD